MYIVSPHEVAADQNPWWRNPKYRPPQGLLPKRDVLPTLLQRCSPGAVDRATALLGPRQVGKSTLLLQVASALLEAGLPPANLLYFDFWDDRLSEQVSVREVVDLVPSGLVETAPRVFLLDEIQRAPRWDRWLKQAVDAQRTVDPARRHRFLVTGSSASALRGGARESGFGRWDDVVLEGLVLPEFLRLSRGLDQVPAELALERRPEVFQRFLRTGGFPGLVNEDSTEEARRALRRDVAEGALYKDLQTRGIDVVRARILFNYLVTTSGSIWNAVQRSSDLGTDRRTLEAWLEALQDARLLVPLAKHDDSGKASKQLRPHPKIYAADHGLVLAFSPLPSPIDDPAIRASVFETAAFAALRAHARAGAAAELTYFRTKSGLEHDFLLSDPRGRVAIEVTTTRKVRPDKVEALKAAATLSEASRTLLVHDGLAPDPDAGVANVPLATFLLEPRRWLEGEA